MFWLPTCTIGVWKENPNMWNFIKKVFFFRVGQKTYGGVARGVGLGRLAVLAGIIGGVRYMRRHA